MLSLQVSVMKSCFVLSQEGLKNGYNSDRHRSLKRNNNVCLRSPCATSAGVQMKSCFVLSKETVLNGYNSNMHRR